MRIPTGRSWITVTGFIGVAAFSSGATLIGHGHVAGDFNPGATVAAGLAAVILAVLLTLASMVLRRLADLSLGVRNVQHSVRELRSDITEHGRSTQEQRRYLEADRRFLRDGMHQIGDKLDTVADLERRQIELWHELNDSNPRPLPRA